MRISDWSSDVCSSDLSGAFLRCKAQNHRFLFHLHQGCPLELSHPESTALLHMLEIDIRYVAVSTEWIYTASISTFSSPLTPSRSEEHTSELQSLMRISYAGFCLKEKKTI